MVVDDPPPASTNRSKKKKRRYSTPKYIDVSDDELPVAKGQSGLAKKKEATAPPPDLDLLKAPEECDRCILQEEVCWVFARKPRGPQRKSCHRCHSLRKSCSLTVTKRAEVKENKQAAKESREAEKEKREAEKERRREEKERQKVAERAEKERRKEVERQRAVKEKQKEEEKQRAEKEKRKEAEKGKAEKETKLPQVILKVGPPRDAKKTEGMGEVSGKLSKKDKGKGKAKAKDQDGEGTIFVPKFKKEESAGLDLKLTGGKCFSFILISFS